MIPPSLLTVFDKDICLVPQLTVTVCHCKCLFKLLIAHEGICSPEINGLIDELPYAPAPSSSCALPVLWKIDLSQGQLQVNSLKLFS